ncbi:MAG: WbqC family protein [bacterium]
MKLAIMQPYFFPYIGYFQLINAVDIFIFYDDVEFIKNGWINRNRIIVNNNISYVTIHLKEASSFKLIKDIEFIDNRKKILKSIFFAYKKAPYFNDVFPVVEKCLNIDASLISDLSISSIKSTSEYLGINTAFKISSKSFADSAWMNKSDRLIDICRKNNAEEYINPEGGKEIYNKGYFKRNNITLNFIKPVIEKYSTEHYRFHPYLSIIDVLMYNSKEDVKQMLNNYELL